MRLCKHSVCLWTYSHMPDKVYRCVCLICAVVCVSARNLSSQQGGWRGDRERLRIGNKSNNSTIFVVYGSEIEFVHQTCSPAMSQRVTSFQLCRCFNLRTSGELELTHLTGWPHNGCSEAIKLSRPITEPLYLTHAAIFSSSWSLPALWRLLIHCDSLSPGAIIKL